MISKVFNDNVLEFTKYEEYDGPIPLMLCPECTILDIFNKYIINIKNKYYSLLEVKYLNKTYNIKEFVKNYPDVIGIDIDIWDKLYNLAKEKQQEKEISKYVSCGSVAASILTSTGHIYTGICIDTACTLGICAERNAIFNMLSNKDNNITKIVVVMPNNKLGIPCGACLELIAQIMPDKYKDILIMIDYEKRKIIKLAELLPKWWGGND